MNRQEDTFWAFINMLGINVNKSTFRNTVNQHPDFPGYNSISDFLRELNVENVTLKATVEELKSYPKPQLVQFGENGADFGILTETHNGSVQYLYDNKKVVEPLESFNEKWNNVALLAEVNNRSGEINYLKNKKQQLLVNLRLPLILAISFFIIGFQLFGLAGKGELQLFPVITILLTKITGLAVSLLLLYETFFPIKSKLLDKICAIGKNVKCASVLESKGAKLFSWLSWSEIGFFYFAGGFLALLYSGNNVPTLTILAALAISSALYVFYSVYYQLFVVKQWCTLCLIIQLIFIIEAICLFPFIYNIPSLFSISLVLEISVYFSIPVLSWLIAKPYILKAVENTGLKKKLLSFKRDAGLFTFKLSQQDRFSDTTGIAQAIHENIDVENQLIIVSGPYCIPCSHIYNKISKLQRHFTSKLNISIIYAVPEDKEDIRHQTAAYLLSLYNKPGIEKANEISKKWYQMPLKDLNKLKEEYAIENITTGALLLKKQLEWCSLNKIGYTPTILFNGHLLPPEYDIEDLIYFID